MEDPVRVALSHGHNTRNHFYPSQNPFLLDLRLGYL